MEQTDAVAWVARGELGAGVTFLGVTSEGDHDEIDRLITSRGMDFPTIVDGAGAYARFGVSSHPTTLYISADGTSRRMAGSQSLQEVEAEIAALVGASAGRNP